MTQDENRDLIFDLQRRSAQAIAAAKATVARSEMLVATSVALRQDTMTTRCAWCNRHFLGGRWVNLHPLLVSRNLIIGATHGISPECITKLRSEGRSV